MAGWQLTKGELYSNNSELELWKGINFLLLEGHKRTTYKHGLLKAILDNLLNVEYLEEKISLSYDFLFEKFTENYWNLITKYKLRQMYSDGKSEYSLLEKTINSISENNKFLSNLEFQSLSADDKYKLINLIKKQCKRNVVGALYQDTNGFLYGFDNEKEEIYFNCFSYDFLLKYKVDIELLNYYSWAKLLEKINNKYNVETVDLIAKLESSEVKQRNDLSIYRSILFHEFQQNNCFYCGAKLKENAPVDHFIPWSFVKEDKLWNLVLACKRCNSIKNNRIAVDKISEIKIRNNIMKSQNNLTDYFTNYTEDLMDLLSSYSLNCGYKEITTWGGSNEL